MSVPQPLPAPPSPERIAQAEAMIRSLDLQRVEKRLGREKPSMSLEHVRLAIEDYRKFLLLICLFPDEEIMPFSRVMDEVWHNHILHTELYAADCDALVGEFIHHEPADGQPPPSGLKERSLALFRAVFHQGPAIVEDF